MFSPLTIQKSDGAPPTPPVVVFDFDGTVLAADSFALVVKELIRRQPWRALLLLIVWPLFLGVLFDWRWPKSALLWSATVGIGARDLVQFFASSPAWIGARCFPQAREEIAKHREAGRIVVYATASVAAWVRPILGTIDPGPKRIVASRIRRRLYGWVIAGPDCRGEEKARRTRERLKLARFHTVYSDSLADLPLLRASDNPIWVNRQGDGFTSVRWAP